MSAERLAAQPHARHQPVHQVGRAAHVAALDQDLAEAASVAAQLVLRLLGGQAFRHLAGRGLLELGRAPAAAGLDGIAFY